MERREAPPRATAWTQLEDRVPLSRRLRLHFCGGPGAVTFLGAEIRMVGAGGRAGAGEWGVCVFWEQIQFGRRRSSGGDGGDGSTT